jgi:hypothetical protein
MYARRQIGAASVTEHAVGNHLNVDIHVGFLTMSAEACKIPDSMRRANKKGDGSSIPW